MREYIKGENLAGVTVSVRDDPKTDMGMIAQDPHNMQDLWYVNRKYFEDNMEEV